MELAPPRLIPTGPNNYDVVHGDDKGLFAEFHMEAEHQGDASEQAGRPIYKDTPYITIIFPADRTKKIVRKVQMEDTATAPSDPHRFPKQWAAFLEQREQMPDGTSLEQWPPMTKSRVKELKAIHIHTVEQVAALTDTTGPNIGLDWRKLRDMAKAYINDAEAGSKLSSALARIEYLENALAAQNQFASADGEQQPKKRGRKPKGEQDGVHT